MSENIMEALREINKAYERLKELTTAIIIIHKLKDSEIIRDNRDFLEEIGVLDDE